MNKTNLAIFASGSGTNAENLGKYFSSDAHIAIREVFSNKKEAGVHERMKNLGIPSTSFSKKEFTDESFLQQLEDIDYIILAGFLWLIPSYLIKHFPERIINIHPALLPKFGGKGMYGNYVHQAVIDSGEKESGITIHLVNEQYDEGRILFQTKCQVDSADTVASLAQKIHQLEYTHFPEIIEKYIKSNHG